MPPKAAALAPQQVVLAGEAIPAPAAHSLVMRGCESSYNPHLYIVQDTAILTEIGIAAIPALDQYGTNINPTGYRMFSRSITDDLEGLNIFAPLRDALPNLERLAVYYEALSGKDQLSFVSAITILLLNGKDKEELMLMSESDFKGLYQIISVKNSATAKSAIALQNLYISVESDDHELGLTILNLSLTSAQLSSLRRRVKGDAVKFQSAHSLNTVQSLGKTFRTICFGQAPQSSH
jgi:hypothetical protein